MSVRSLFLNWTLENYQTCQGKRKELEFVGQALLAEKEAHAKILAVYTNVNPPETEINCYQGIRCLDAGVREIIEGNISLREEPLTPTEYVCSDFVGKGSS